MDRYFLDQRILERNTARHDDLMDRSRNVIVKAEWFQRPYSIFDQPLCRDDAETEALIYLSQYNMHARAAERGLDNIPFFRVDFCRVAYQMAIAYGCKTLDAPYSISAYPKIYDIEEVYNIKKPENILECGYYPELVRRMHKIEERWGDVGFVPADTQSPVDVFTSIVDSEEALCAMYTNKEAAHYFLNMLTESIAESVEGLKAQVKNWVGGGHDYPITRGIHLSDDDAAFLSPETYAEFTRPYNERLARRFGGVTLHCCMCYYQCIEEMSKTEGLLGMDPQFHWHSDEEILPFIRDKGFLRQFWIPDGRDVVEYYKEIIDKTEGICGLMLEVGGASEEETVAKALEIKEYAAKKNRLYNP